jgi:hypothetical protein
MTGMPNSNPLSAIAHDSIGMAKDTGDKTFKLFAIISMGVSGIIALLHSVHMIYRDLRPKREKENDRPEGSYQPSRPADYDDEPPHHDRDNRPSETWVARARREERAGGEKRWSEDCGHNRQSRQH